MSRAELATDGRVAGEQIARQPQQGVEGHEPRRQEPLARPTGQGRGGLDERGDDLLVHSGERGHQLLRPPGDLQGLVRGDAGQIPAGRGHLLAKVVLQRPVALDQGHAPGTAVQEGLEVERGQIQKHLEIPGHAAAVAAERGDPVAQRRDLRTEQGAGRRRPVGSLRPGVPGEAERRQGGAQVPHHVQGALEGERAPPERRSPGVWSQLPGEKGVPLLGEQRLEARALVHAKVRFHPGLARITPQDVRAEGVQGGDRREVEIEKRPQGAPGDGLRRDPPFVPQPGVGAARLRVRGKGGPGIVPRQRVQLVEAPGQSFAQLRSRLLGEGDRRHPVDRGSGPGDQVQGALHQKRGLARPSAGHHDQVAVELGDRAPAVGVVGQAGPGALPRHDSSPFPAFRPTSSSSGAYLFFSRNRA